MPSADATLRPFFAPLIGFGQVRHTRLQPRRHAFAYGTYFLMLPLRSMAAYGACDLACNRFAPLSFYDCDHGDGRGPQQGGALAWLDGVLAQEGIGSQQSDSYADPADGEVWLHCFPRVLGHSFKPVSFWYCHRKDGSLRAMVVEVNNTFGERHCYVLDAPQYGVEQQVPKVFHVSPFCPVAGHYRFRFMVTPMRDRTVARIDYDDPSGPVLQTSVSGQLRRLDSHSSLRAVWRYPALTLGVVLRIHWQALKLFARRTPFFGKPSPPQSFISR